MINAVAEAKAMAKKESEKATVFVPLSILQALLAEIDRLRDLQSGNRPGVNTAPLDALANVPKDEGFDGPQGAN